jgi:hypothetical protein
MRRSIVLPAVLVGLGAASVGRGSAVNFHLVSDSVEVNQPARTATFKLNFDQPPDFIPVGQAQKDAFQYEIDANHASFGQPIGYGDISAVIRGNEIWQGNGIPVRQRDGDGGANSGGWGPVRALVPFDLTGSTLTFTASLDTLGDQDGQFRYRLITTDSGTLTGETNGAVIPLPAAVWSGLMMLGGLGAARKLRHQIR